MGFEAMRLGETPWSKCRDSRGPGLSSELPPREKSGHRGSQQREMRSKERSQE